MDLFVLPSHMEGMPNALIEAMAAGRPTVATDAGGNAEVVADGETGLIVPPRNPARLADAILTLLKDPERAEAMGRAGRGRYEAHFTVPVMVARFEAFYRERLRARGESRGR
jgi:glycosyltransferase involved in cell wall biosynthesis